MPEDLAELLGIVETQHKGYIRDLGCMGLIPALTDAWQSRALGDGEPGLSLIPREEAQEGLPRWPLQILAQCMLGWGL